MYELPALLQPLSPDANHTEVAYHSIKRAIIEAKMHPGSQFTEGELARAAGVSKSPVRDALGRLQRDGLVESIPRSGYRVTPVTLATTRELTEFRTILEPAAAALAATRGVPADMLKRLQELASEQLARSWSETEGGIEAYLRSNFEFDSLIAGSCGNRQLARSVVDVLDNLERVLRLILPLLTWSETRVKQRTEIVDALASGDAERAEATVRARTEDSAKEVFDALLRSPSILDATIVAS